MSSPPDPNAPGTMIPGSIDPTRYSDPFYAGPVMLVLCLDCAAGTTSRAITVTQVPGHEAWHGDQE